MNFGPYSDRELEQMDRAMYRREQLADYWQRHGRFEQAPASEPTTKEQPGDSQ